MEQYTLPQTYREGLRVNLTPRAFAARRKSGLGQWLGALVVFAVLMAPFAGQYGVAQYRAHREAAFQARIKLAGVPWSAPMEEYMPNWKVEGAGDAGYNGVYVETGTFDSHSAYELDSGHWLYWWGMASRWALGSSLGASPAYLSGSGDLPGNPWSAQSGTAPAPTLSEDTGGGGGGEFFSWGYFQIVSPEAGGTTPPGTLDVDWLAATDDWPEGFVDPGTIKANLYAWPVYADASEGPASGPFYCEAPLIWNPDASQWEVAGTIQVTVETGHGSTFDLHATCQGVVTDSNSPPVDWTFSTGDVNALISISGEPTAPPPVITITTPANAATVQDTVAVRFVASDPLGLTSISLAIDGVVVYTPGGALGTNASGSYRWDTTAETNGLHYLTATAVGADAQTASATIVVTVNNAPGGGGADPTCEIHYPGAGATGLAGTVTCQLWGDDDSQIAEAWLYIDGAQVCHWTPAVASWRGTYDWNTLDFSNGTHTLDLTVEDDDGNVATATRRTVTVENAELADGDLWVSEQFTLLPIAKSNLPAEIAANVALGLKATKVLLAPVITPSSNPDQTYGLEFGLDCGGAWAGGFDGCQSLIPFTLMQAATPFEDARVAIRFSRLVDWTTWALAEPAVIDSQIISDTKLLLLVAGPPARIYKFDGTNPAEVWFDLAGSEWEGYAAVAFRVLGSKLYIGCTTDDATPEPAILVQDLDGSGEPDAAQKTYALQFASRNPHIIGDMEVVGTTLAVGTDDGAGHGDLWTVQADDVRFVSAAIPGIRALWVDGSTLYAGAANGHVYVSGASQYTTGEAHVNAGLVVSGKHYLATGDGGKLFRRVSGAWEALATIPTLTEPAPMAPYYGRIWFGGDGADLYALELAGGNFQRYATTGFSAITQLVGFAGKLLVFGTGGGNLFQSLVITTSHLTGRCVDDLGFQIVSWEAVA